MSKQSAKTELVELVSGPQKGNPHIIIYAYNGLYKSRDITNKTRRAIDSITEKTVKELQNNSQYAIMLFLPQGKKKPAWINEDAYYGIPVNRDQEDLLKHFFAFEFTVKEYASLREYYAGNGMPENEEKLKRGVDQLWSDYAKALIAGRENSMKKRK